MTASVGNNNIAPTLEMYRRTHAVRTVVQKESDLAVEAPVLPETTFAQKVNRKRNMMANTAGFLTGLTAPAYVLYDTFHKVSPSEANDMAEAMQSLLPSVDTLANTKNTVEKILQDTGLKEKGLKINYIDSTKSASDHLREVISNEVSQNSIFGTRLKENYYNIFKAGGNAAFFPKSNEIVMSEKGLYDTVYHEIGHAMNKNGNIFTRMLQKSRAVTPFMVSVVAPIALGVALLHKVDKDKPKEQKGFSEKTLDFIANHATGLTALSYVPILAEEGLASVRGLMLAGKYLKSDMMGKLTANFAKAWCTYAGVAALVTGGVALGIKLADYLKTGEWSSKKA